MNAIQDFFLTCAGINKTILKRTPTEVNKYVGIGATIFFTGIFATIAAGFALYTIFSSLWIVIPVALLWGLMIFNLDRFIVSTMKKKGVFWRDFATASPRIVLAVIISIVIAKPMELKIFESEIESELVKMEQETFKVQDELVKTRYTASIDSLNTEVAILKSEIIAKQVNRDSLVAAANMEADGTGGSMQRNLGPIYATKRAAADKVQSELDYLLAVNNSLILAKQTSINDLNTAQQTELNNLNRVNLSGFAARLEGLERAGQRSSAIYWANIFVMLLFIAIETAPVITKLIIERSPYDFVLDKHEHVFAMNHRAITSKQTNLVMNEVNFEKEIASYKTNLAVNAEKEIAKEEIRKRIEELKEKARLTPDFLKQSSLFGA